MYLNKTLILILSDWIWLNTLQRWTSKCQKASDSSSVSTSWVGTSLFHPLMMASSYQQQAVCIIHFHYFYLSSIWIQLKKSIKIGIDRSIKLCRLKIIRTTHKRFAPAHQHHTPPRTKRNIKLAGRTNALIVIQADLW